MGCSESAEKVTLKAPVHQTTISRRGVGMSGFQMNFKKKFSKPTITPRPNGQLGGAVLSKPKASGFMSPVPVLANLQEEKTKEWTILEDFEASQTTSI